jgi:hypothetical protein
MSWPPCSKRPKSNLSAHHPFCPKTPESAQEVASNSDLLGKAGGVNTQYTAVYLLTISLHPEINLAKIFVSRLSDLVDSQYPSWAAVMGGA